MVLLFGGYGSFIRWPRRVNNFPCNSSATMEVCNGSGKFTIEVGSYNGSGSVHSACAVAPFDLSSARQKATPSSHTPFATFATPTPRLKIPQVFSISNLVPYLLCGTALTTHVLRTWCVVGGAFWGLCSPVCACTYHVLWHV